MFKSTKEPITAKSSYVHTTEDYFMFKPLDGNRKKNQLHIKRLKKSMQENYLFTVIIVNENYEIIDGQHRFDVIKELGLPLHYIVCEGYGLKEVQVLNQNSKNWTADDYMEGYASLGMKDYVVYMNFKRNYKFGHNECMTLLGGNRFGGSTLHSFKDGTFKIKDYNAACIKAEKIKMIKNYYDGYNRRAFVFAMNTLLNNGNFEFTEFLHKLKMQPSAMVDCTSSAQYISLIEEIYNYKRRDKVNLRY